MLKLDEPFRIRNMLIFTFFTSSDLGFIYTFWLILSPLEPDLWIRIFLRIQIQEANILRIPISLKVLD